MRQVLQYVGYVLLLALAGFLIWKFSFIIVWIVMASIVSFFGRPIVHFFDKIHIGKWKFPHTGSAMMALVTIVLVIAGIIAIFVPLIVNEAQTISKIDVNLLTKNLEGPLHWVDDQLHSLGVIPDGQTLQDFMVIKAKSLVSMGSITSIMNGFLSAAGTIFVGLFSVLFIAFFFLTDETMFQEILLIFIPEKYHEATRKVIADSTKLLLRYFVGVLLEVLGVMTIISLGLWILGVKNAILIGFFGGMMNIIPYLGPVIGALIAVVLGVTGVLAAGAYNEIMLILGKLGGVLLVANFVDNNILVPVIYSKSVKAHPLEIFFVIIIGGNLAGLVGMLLAIPVYTVLRVIAREFFQEFRIIKKLTAKID
jgi:predicted PurR-regulated permease PerM